MPVRIYDIAKKLGIESKEVLVKAKELGISTARVPSSSLDKITAEYLEEQLGYKPAPPAAPVQEAAPVPPAPAPVAKAPEVSAPAPVSPPPPVVEAAPAPAPVQQPVPAAPKVAPSAPAIEPTPVAAEVPPVKVEVEIVPPVAAPAPAAKVEAPVPPVPEARKAAPVVQEPSPAPAAATIAEPVSQPAPKPAPETPPAVETKAQPEPIIQVIKPAEAPEIKVIIQPPTPPAPPIPKVGDKVGFIVLPPKPGPKVGDKVGSVQLPSRSGGRGGRQETRQGARPGQNRTSGRQPFGSRHGVVQPKPAGGRSGGAEAPKFVAPATGEMLTMKPPIVVRSLADMLKRKPFQLIADLMELGVFANVNQTIEEPVAQRLCAKYGFRFEVEKRERGGGQIHAPVIKKEEDQEDKPESLKPRPPVVTIMGHVDHGKTTLLDVIRKSDVAGGEAGGITQHIGAYTISFPHPERPKEIQQITFLDTPGHAAFSAMRARGANVTDIVVLVVAANDGVMPQTVEAINHAKAAKVPIMVAVNKCDHPNANPMRVRQQLQEAGLVCEEWGGNTIFQDLSALTKKGVDKLLELILLQAEMMELKANPDRPAKGNVIESGLEPGGPTATVLVRKGTLKVGDLILCGPYYGKARALTNEEGKRLKSAGPSVAVKLLGLNGVPAAGLEFSAVEGEKDARDVAEQRAEMARVHGAEDRPKVTLENLFASLSSESAKVLKVVVKADMQGSVEAIIEALKKIDSEKVSLEIVHSAVGIITESDVILASASKAIVLGFHTRVDSEATEAAKREGVQIKLYSIIYELIDQVKDAMAGLLEPVSKEVVLGSAEVKKLFSLSKGGNVAGCMVSNGRVVRGRCRVLRHKDVVFEGIINAIRRFQDEASEVRAGMECGIRIEGFGDFQVGDSIESYTIEKMAQKL
jgi:translation initiation factor IF-2